MRRIAFVLIAAVVVAGTLFAAMPMDVSAAVHQPLGFFVAGAMMVGADLGRLASATALATPTADLIFMAAPTVESLRADAEALIAENEGIVATADAEERALTDEEIETIEANKVKVVALGKQISARESASPVLPGTGRKTAPEPTNRGDPASGGRRTVAASPRDTQRHGFTSMGEFAQIVAGHARGDDTARTRLTNVATTFGSEAVGADGGFAVPPEFRRQIWEKVNSQENLLTRCAGMETAGNSITIPKDETTPWQTSGGITAHWEGEGDAANPTKPQLKLDTIRLAKLMALVPISEELLADAPAIESWLRLKAPAKMVAKINTAIVRGTGVGQPLGILNASSLISIAKETSQDAASVWFANIVKMWTRLYSGCRSTAIWLINQDVEQSLYQMAFDPEASSKVPVYMPPGGLSASPYATLLGRPVVPCQPCSTLGTQGDVILVDLQQYLSLTKAGQGVQTDVSMHLYFDQALQAFRFIFRVNGQPMWGATIAQEQGSNTLSWAVAIDARA